MLFGNGTTIHQAGQYVAQIFWCLIDTIDNKSWYAGLVSVSHCPIVAVQECVNNPAVKQTTACIQQGL